MGLGHRVSPRGLDGGIMTAVPDPLPPPPPGLSPAVGAYRPSRRTQWIATAMVIALPLLVVAGKGAWPPSTGLIAFLAGGVGLFVVKGLRAQVSVGPGWLATQGVLRRTYVRTDALTSCKDERSGIDRVIVLKDSDGRRVGVMYGELSRDTRMQDQLRRDVQASVAKGLELSAGTAVLLGVPR